MTARLPARICVLDIETAKTKFARPEESELAFAGTKVYALHNNRYYAHKHRCFMPDQARQLEKFVKSFRGIIIGHNIFDFDYRVLRPLISLAGVIDKTVDTLAFLQAKHGKRVGLSLDSLSRANLGRRKTLKGKHIPKLWREGKWKKVIDHNEVDCILTQALWRHLVRQRPVRLRYRDRRGQRHDETIDASLALDRSYLTGKIPFYSLRSWKQRIRTWNRIRQERSKEGTIGELDGYLHAYHGFWCELCGRIVLFRPKPRKGSVYCPECGAEGKKARFKWSSRTGVYHWFYCAHCEMTVLFESQVKRRRARWQATSCPGCGNRFGDIRADYDYVRVRAKHGRLGDGDYVYEGDEFPPIAIEDIAYVPGNVFCETSGRRILVPKLRGVLVTRLRDYQS